MSVHWSTFNPSSLQRLTPQQPLWRSDPTLCWLSVAGEQRLANLTTWNTIKSSHRVWGSGSKHVRAEPLLCSESDKVEIKVSTWCVPIWMLDRRKIHFWPPLALDCAHLLMAMTDTWVLFASYLHCVFYLGSCWPLLPMEALVGLDDVACFTAWQFSSFRPAEETAVQCFIFA